ncbi:MAG: HEPN domain-containing protein, partial [Crenarchaeota archaeon]|nr:HEPN domain-containing protein [Thermoproteota archaeon]
MGSRVNSEIQRLLNERKLMRAQISREMISKELTAAEADLADAQDSLQSNKFKWATIQGYYSMFHSARALLYSKGFREKSHFALFLALRALFPKEIEASLIRQFEECMSLRQEADYGLTFSET